MKNYLKKSVASVLAVLAAVGKLFAPYEIISVPRGVPSGFRLKQGGFVLLGGRGYMGYAGGTVVELPASTEAALVASGQATVSAGPPTPGSISTTALSGCVGVPIGASTVAITNPNITVQSIIYAVISQAAADATFTSILRVNVASGAFTIIGNANTTAVVSIDWCILNPNGSLSSPI